MNISKKFEDLGLNSSILKAIETLGFEEASDIQAQSIPIGVEGHDIIGLAQTGTGKTLAFGSIILNNMPRTLDFPKVIILTPTRELAIQINDELVRLAKFSRVKILPVYGGQSLDRQIKALRNGVDIIVGTPGRVIDHIKRGTLNLKAISSLVLDEADEMLNMGFIGDIEYIMSNCSSERQTLLFSATMSKPIKMLAKKYMKSDAKQIAIQKNTVTVSTVEQYYFEVKVHNRFETLCRILDTEDYQSIIIFCKTKKGVDEVTEQMLQRGYSAQAMHGDLTQYHRLATLKKFKNGDLDFLIATDVAARGIDVENITHVINYDLPQDVDSYVHRIGRTARANRKGIAYSLVTPKEFIMLKDIERTIKTKVIRKDIPTVDDILEVKFKSVVDKVKDIIDSDGHKEYFALSENLAEEYNLLDVSSALIKLYLEDKMAFEYKENNLNSEDSMRLFISVGRVAGLTPKVLVNYLEDLADIPGSDINKVKILDNFSFVSVPERYYTLLSKKCKNVKLLNKRVFIEQARER